MNAARVVLDSDKVASVSKIVRTSKPPAEDESGDLAFSWSGSADELANAYLAIVAICHQTSPVGEPRLEGNVAGKTRYGWDYLKARYLAVANGDRRWAQPTFWEAVSPAELSAMYSDKVSGLTLNRVDERAYLLNDLGRMMRRAGVAGALDAFRRAGDRLGGESGFLQFLAEFEAYRDPVRKKSLFFSSIAVKECGWRPVDLDQLLSPVDYHELRGHLRIGTVRIVDDELHRKVVGSVALTELEDTEIRIVVQQANDAIATSAAVSSSVLHYLLWNIFRNCCPRQSDLTHCASCLDCKLPPQYKAMPTYEGRCIFHLVCDSAGKPDKVQEQPYLGHFY